MADWTGALGHCSVLHRAISMYLAYLLPNCHWLSLAGWLLAIASVSSGVLNLGAFEGSDVVDRGDSQSFHKLDEIGNNANVCIRGITT